MNLNEPGISYPDFFQISKTRSGLTRGLYIVGRFLRRIGGGGFLDLARLFAHGGNVLREPRAVNRRTRLKRGSWR